MSNLQTHIASLEALITKANALPTEKKIQETKTVSPSTSSQTVQPDSGYDGLGKVTVNAMPTGNVGTPSISIDANGKITATAAVDAGYVDGTDKTGTKTMTTQAAKTVTPTKSSQTAVAKNVYTTGVVTVGAIPDKYQDVSGVTANGLNVESGKVIVTSNGTQQTGILKTNKVVLDTNPSGYIAGNGGTSAELTITGKSPVGELVADFDALGNVDPSKVLAGSTFSSGGYLNTSGTMPNNGSMSKTIDGLETKSATIPAGYTTGGTVSLDSTIDNTANAQAAKIAEIAALLEGKSVGGSGGSSGGSSMEACAVTMGFTGSKCTRYVLYQQVLEDGSVQATNGSVTIGMAGGSFSFIGKKGSFVVYHNNGDILNSLSAGSLVNAEQVLSTTAVQVFKIGQSDTAEIYCFS